MEQSEPGTNIDKDLEPDRNTLSREVKSVSAGDVQQGGIAELETARVRESTFAQLVARIYDVARPSERCRILEHLMRPLGVLALVGICNGIFAKIWFRNGWHDLHIRPEDAQAIRSEDIVSLVDFVQQASMDTVNNLASLLASSPMIVYSGTAALLIAEMVRRIRANRTQPK